MEDTILKDISNVAVEARNKAIYLRMRPEGCGLWNWEQAQGAPDVLEELAGKLELLVAKYVKKEDLDKNTELKIALSRQCKSAIRNCGNSLLYGL